MMPKIDEAFPADSSVRDAAAQADRSEQVFQAKCEAIMATILERSGNGADKSNTEGT